MPERRRGTDEGNPTYLPQARKPAKKLIRSGAISEVLMVSDAKRTTQVLAKKPGECTGITLRSLGTSLRPISEGGNGDQATLS